MQIWENCISRLYRNIQRRICWKKTFCNFWTMSKNFPLVKTVFYMSRGSFQWSFFWKNVYFSKFLLFERISSVLAKRLPAGLPKLKRTFPQENLERKYFVEKIVCVLFLFRNEPKTLTLRRKFFGSVVKTAFDVSIISIWEFFLRKSQILFSNRAHWANPFRHSVEDFRAGLLEITILFFNHSQNWANNFRAFDEKKQ